MDFKKERIDCHNKFPEVVQFKAELKFKEKLEKASFLTPFIPVELGYGDDAVYQKCIGHLIDGLESLPYRPDQMFDHCFRVIDEAGAQFFPKKGIKGIVQGVGNKLLNQSRAEWEEIILILGSNIPLMTCRFITKRICESHFRSDDSSKQLSDRAVNCFGSKFYNEFIDRFALDENGVKSEKISTDKINKGASFLKLYLSGNKGTNKSANKSYESIDLTKENNLPSSNKRIEFILSLLLFNMRNERAHGSVLSPFRTSKSSIDRYRSYYYAMLCSYIFCLGVLQLRNFGNLDGTKIKICAERNVDIQKIFFS